MADTKSANPGLPPHAARAYDEAVARVIPYYDLIHDEAIDLVRVAMPDARVWLDTGCGTGRMVEKALPLFPRARFLLADPSHDMLVEAHKRFGRMPMERVTIFGRTDSQGLPDRVTEAPDVLTAIQCHHYLDASGRRAATKACFDVLAPGGMYVTFENSRPCTPAGVEIGLARLREFQVVQGRSAKDADAHIMRFDREYFPITVDEHLELLRSAGFSAVELFWFSYMQAGFYAIK